MDNKKLLYKQLNALRLEVDGSIVDAIKKTVDELFAPAPEAVGEERRGMKHGIYYLHWKSGGKSIAAVGYDRSGNNWFAPCNWISGVWKDWSSVESAELLFENDYSNDNELKASDPRWRGEQHCKCQQLINSEPVTFLLQNALRNLNEEQRIALRDALIERTSNIPCCARWVKGEYDRLYHLGKSGKRIACFVDYDWLRDGTRILRDIAVLTPQTMNIGARGICYISPCADENTTEKEDFILKCEQSNVEWLDESPCTCQQVVLLTREEAEEWADTSYPGDDIFAISSRNYMMDMYDRIAEKINQQK